MRVLSLAIMIAVVALLQQFAVDAHIDEIVPEKQPVQKQRTQTKPASNIPVKLVQKLTINNDGNPPPKTQEGLKMNFAPNIHQNPLPPNVAGSATDYGRLEDNFKRSEQANQVREIENAEESAAMGFGSHQLALQGHAEHMQGWEQKVEKMMNSAAGKAAVFKKTTSEHNSAAANVKVADVKVQHQNDRVKQAMATLKAEQKALREAKGYKTKMVRIEEHARYSAEQAGDEYTKAKAAAISEDNKLQEHKHETKMKEEYEKVALSAVAQKAKEDEAAVKSREEKSFQKHKTLQKHKQAFAEAVTKGKKAEETQGMAVLKDCTTLPKIYSRAGGKCSDCPTWKDKGECTSPQFKKFMAHYCPASCAKKVLPKKKPKSPAKMATPAYSSTA